MGKWAFFSFLVIIYNMKYTSTIIHIFPLLVIVIFPWRNPKKIIQIENKQMFCVCLFVRTSPNLLLGWSSAVK